MPSGREGGAVDPGAHLQKDPEPRAFLSARSSAPLGHEVSGAGVADVWQSLLTDRTSGCRFAWAEWTEYEHVHLRPKAEMRVVWEDVGVTEWDVLFLQTGVRPPGSREESLRPRGRPRSVPENVARRRDARAPQRHCGHAGQCGRGGARCAGSSVSGLLQSRGLFRRPRVPRSSGYRGPRGSHLSLEPVYPLIRRVDFPHDSSAPPTDTVVSCARTTERKWMRRTLYSHRITFQLSADAKKCRLRRRADLPTLVWSGSRKSWNKMMHALNGNTAPNAAALLHESAADSVLPGSERWAALAGYVQRRNHDPIERASAASAAVAGDDGETVPFVEEVLPSFPLDNANVHETIGDELQSGFVHDASRAEEARDTAADSTRRALEREQARLHATFGDAHALTARPPIGIDVVAPQAPAHLSDQEGPAVAVPADGLCLYYCAVACANLAHWRASHDDRTGLARDPVHAARDLTEARAVQARVINAARRAGQAELADRLEGMGLDSFPDQDVFPYLAEVLGGQIVVQTLTLQWVYGTGPLAAHLMFCTTADGAGHGTGHYVALQSWVPRPAAEKRLRLSADGAWAGRTPGAFLKSVADAAGGFAGRPERVDVIVDRDDIVQCTRELRETVGLFFPGACSEVIKVGVVQAIKMAIAVQIRNLEFFIYDLEIGILNFGFGILNLEFGIWDFELRIFEF